MSASVERLLLEWECAPWSVRWVVELMIECRLAHDFHPDHLDGIDEA